jgi:cytochrome bd-type quinol oxidase subunit 1
MTQANLRSAKAFRTVVTEIGQEIRAMWLSNSNAFQVHPAGTPAPITQKGFRDMFQAEIVDANSASVVSGARGIPIASMNAGPHMVAGKSIQVNQTQLQRQQPNLRDLVAMIE